MKPNFNLLIINIKHYYANNEIYIYILPKGTARELYELLDISIKYHQPHIKKNVTTSS